jgi:solute carrier family 29 (equilibrative nucleoside transporter), member 1/2/3
VVPKVILSKIWVEAGTLFFTFLITYMLYPGIVFPKKKDIIPSRIDWSIFYINITYGLSDLLGRTLAKYKSSYSRSFLVPAVLLRLIFVATTFTIALSDAEFWNQGAIVLVNVCLLGLTNGLFATASCNTIPGRLENHEKEFGGFVMSVMINGAIFVGSLISLVGFSRMFE